MSLPQILGFSFDFSSAHNVIFFPVSYVAGNMAAIHMISLSFESSGRSEDFRLPLYVVT